MAGAGSTERDGDDGGGSVNGNRAPGREQNECRKKVVTVEMKGLA